MVESFLYFLISILLRIPKAVSKVIPPPEGGAAPAPAGADVQDTTGGGGAQIGTGTAPAPGEEGFTGNV